MAAENGSNKIPSPFDVRTIKDLVALMSRHELSEIDLREGELRIRLRRGPRGQMSIAGPAAFPMQAPMGIPAPSPMSAAAPAASGGEPAARSGKQLLEIKAPTPGTFYSSSSPEAEPFVQVGSRVQSSTVVCIIEAMKIFNEIPAECSGVIAEVCVKNQEAVEYGQVLFKVDPAG